MAKNIVIFSAGTDSAGLGIYRFEATFDPRADGPMHDSRGGRCSRLYIKRPALLAGCARPDAPWILGGAYTVDETPYA